jgi:hypothetical protein
MSPTTLDTFLRGSAVLCACAIAACGGPELVAEEGGERTSFSASNSSSCYGKSYATDPHGLSPGESLKPGEDRKSRNGRFKLSLQLDGNLVLYDNGSAYWASGTHGRAVSKLLMQCDGNLVLYGYHKPIWASGTDGQPHARLVLQDDGNLVIYRPNAPVWASHTRRTAATGPSAYLDAGKNLERGKTLSEPGGRFRLTLQDDGNLVLYDQKSPIWDSGTHGKAVSKLSMQHDGNLVLYGYHKPVWSTHTSNHPGAFLALQPDGNLVIYRKSYPVWASNTVR